jgi:hypothetical protein
VIVIAALVGAGVGALTIFMMFHAGMLAERSGAAVLLAAIAVFYPVFAAQEGDVTALVLHIAVFAGFVLLAQFGFQRGMHLLAGGLVGHGIFDIGLHIIGAPGPLWWPVFCASVDIVAGMALIRLLQTRKVPQ